MVKIPEFTEKQLWNLHLAAALAHFAQSLALFILGGIRRDTIYVHNTVRLGRPGVNSTFITNELPLEPLFVSAAFALMSGISHVVQLTRLHYILAKEFNGYLWAEYVLSAPTDRILSERVLRMVGAVRRPDRRKEQAVEIVDFGDGPHGRPGVVRDGLLVDGDGRRKAPDLFDAGVVADGRNDHPGIGQIGRASCRERVSSPV